MFHRQGDREIVEALDAATGEPKWEQSYPTAYVDRYGYSSGPRATPMIRGGVVFTLGAEGQFRAWSLADGKPPWQRNVNADYKVEQGFFGVGASPRGRTAR